MIRALSGALGLSVAVCVLLAGLWSRDIATRATAEAEAAQLRAALRAETGRRRECLGMVDAERAEVATCRRDAADAAAEAREVERQACGRLVSAARAQGRLDVDPADLSAVVAALRSRRR